MVEELETGSVEAQVIEEVEEQENSREARVEIVVAEGRETDLVVLGGSVELGELATAVE